MEPRAATPRRRLEAIAELASAGIPTAVMAAPLIPSLNDAELEEILDAAAQAGALEAGYIVLRLPHEIKDLFRQWLNENAPHRAERIMRLVRGMRGGRDYDATFGTRLTGSGHYADLIRRRFDLACKRFGLNRRALNLDLTRFRPPAEQSPQLSLFG
jgi:DNA repair photolyase